jgi:replicative DNA helicase
MDTLRIPPQNPDAERSVLGAVMLTSNAVDEIDLQSHDFYDGRHQILFRVICDIHRSGLPVDAVTVAEELDRRNELSQVGGPLFIAEIVEAVPHAAHVRHYASIVRSKARQRALIQACSETLQKAYDEDADEVLPEIESKLISIRESSSGGDIVTMADAVEALEQRERNPAAIHATGLRDIDRQIRGGLRDGQLLIVGGRPGSGKSVLAGQIAKAFAERGEPALIVSLEMDRAELAERYDRSIDRQTLRGLPIYLVDSAFDTGRIAGLIRLATRKHSIRIAVVDYLQLTESGNRTANRERQVAEVSRMLKRLASELRIPVLAACQLNRNNDREQRLPRLSDLRESGSIEQDADIVVLLHHTETDSKAIIAKHRNGATGIVPLTFCGEQFRFDDHSHYDGTL